MGRNVALWGALLIIGVLTFLTIRVAINDGLDVLVFVSIVILALMGVGVLGALSAPPDD
jgi:hypothetical protein